MVVVKIKNNNFHNIMGKISFRKIVLISLFGLGGITGLAYTAYGTTIGGNVTTVSLYATGSTGIGTTTPATLLEVQSFATSTLTITTASSTPQDPVLSFRTGANPSENFKIYVDDSDSDKLVIATSTSGNFLTITQGGNVGVSTTSPQALLDVYGASNKVRLSYNMANYTDLSVGSDGQLTIAPVGNATTTISSTGLIVGVNKLVLDKNSGRVAIGTSTPATLLEIYSQATSTLTITSSSSTAAQDPVLSFRTGDAPSENFKIYVDDSANDTLVIATSTSSNLLTINVAGNVGISTTTAISLFAIENIGALNSFYVSDAAEDTSPFVIDASGNVGIGTTTPSSLLSVQGAILGSSNITLYGTATSTFVGPIAQPSGNLTIGSATGNLLLNPYGGNVGIGTTTPATILHVSSDSATTTITVGDAGSGKGGCLKIRDNADGAWVYCRVTGGNIACSANSCE